MNNWKEKNKILEINAHLSDEQVSLYADALKLNKESGLPQTLVSHVENCSGCKQVVLNLYEIIKSQNVEYRGRHPYLEQPAEVLFQAPTGRSNRLKYMLRIAAVLALIVASGYVFLFVFQKYF